MAAAQRGGDAGMLRNPYLQLDALLQLEVLPLASLGGGV